ncbi:MAG: hypothetical protein ACKOPC_05835 [Methylocystis sp.]
MTVLCGAAHSSAHDPHDITLMMGISPYNGPLLKAQSKASGEIYGIFFVLFDSIRAIGTSTAANLTLSQYSRLGWNNSWG